jgi:hypothetical protein
MSWRHYLQRLSGVLSLFFLAGCATLSHEQCVRGDWFGLGIRDGYSGEPISRLSEHINACLEYGVTVNNSNYFAGREQGLKSYCQFDNAFATGLHGQAYLHVCPQQIDALFNRYHSAAFSVHEDGVALESLDNQLSGKERSLHDKKLTDDSRNRIRDDIRGLDRRRDRLRDDLYYHQRQLDDFRREAQYYR